MSSIHSLVVLILLIGGVIPWFGAFSDRFPTGLGGEHQLRTLDRMHMFSIPSKTTWIGDAWILPPNQHMFSAEEIRRYFFSHSVLVIGDEQVSRIHFGTLVEILIDTGNNPSRNRLGNSTFLDRRYVANERFIRRTFHNHSLDFVQIECFQQVQDFLKESNLQSYDVVVIATGKLETQVPFQRKQCETPDTLAFPDGAILRMTSLMKGLNDLSPIPVIWRNGAFSRESQHGQVLLMDERVKDELLRVDNVRLLDYAAAIQERIYHRIAPERALLFIQLLMNVLP